MRGTVKRTAPVANNHRTDERKARWDTAAQWWTEGRPVKEIAAMVGVSRVSVYIHAERYWPKRPHHPGGRKPGAQPRRKVVAATMAAPAAVARDHAPYWICTSCGAATNEGACNLCGSPTRRAN